MSTTTARPSTTLDSTLTTIVRSDLLLAATAIEDLARLLDASVPADDDRRPVVDTMLADARQRANAARSTRRQVIAAQEGRDPWTTEVIDAR